MTRRLELRPNEITLERTGGAHKQKLDDDEDDKQQVAPLATTQEDCRSVFVAIEQQETQQETKETLKKLSPSSKECRRVQKVATTNEEDAIACCATEALEGPFGRFASVLLTLAGGLLQTLGRALGALLFQLLGQHEAVRASCEQEELDYRWQLKNEKNEQQLISSPIKSATLPAGELERERKVSQVEQQSSRGVKSHQRRPALNIEMVSRTVVAGFEGQVIANELSSRLIEEALETFKVNFAESKIPAPEMAACQLESVFSSVASSGETPSEPEQEAPFIQVNQESSSPPETRIDEVESSQESSPRVVIGEPEMQQEEQQADNQAAPTQDDLQAETRATLEADKSATFSSDNLNELQEEPSLISCCNFDDFCGQQASELNLRQLKMEALEDVLVCGQNRHSTESARRLFSLLESSPNSDETLSSTRLCGDTKLNQSNSLSSRSSGHYDGDEDDDLEEQEQEELLALSCQPDDENETKLHIQDQENRAKSDTYDYGTIKLDRRKCCGGAASSCADLWPGNNNNNCTSTSNNYGRTLVCSVSPVSSSSRNSTQLEMNEGKCGELLVLSERQLDTATACYPIDGDEMRQCRAAFRENRRLIEQAQALAFKRMQEQAGDELQNSSANSHLSRSSSQNTLMTERSHWADSLRRRPQPAKCSHCKRDLYPVDRMELDFTRAKLNIHRNCFKCQVCSTLLRLETYASIDTKLYCPAHTKRATPLAPRTTAAS